MANISYLCATDFRGRMSIEKEAYPLLSLINEPDDLNNLNSDQLIQLSEELRQYIINIVSSNPGHFGASLGVVELSVALHHVYNSPHDKIIWDVGHQAYGHKILTGRRDDFHTNRKYKGISGFPKPSESKHDAFGVGHSSTSISAALGMAAARDFNKGDNKIIAVIGDGSLSGGIAYEALNNAGHEMKDILVILNDNNMSIDPSVGAMKEYLLDITTSKTYNKVKKDVWNLLGYLNKINPNTRQYFQKIENAIKSIALKQSNLFESINFRYFGPVDGHDVVHLSEVLKDMKNIDGPKILHVLTKKGKGFPMAELNQTTFHSPGKFNPVTGEVLAGSSRAQPPKFQDVFGDTVLELARKNKKIVGITPAMPTGSSLKTMMDEMPDRSFDVGIAEQHAVTFAAGLASCGMVPYCTIYSTFLQRAYDQVIHDVALQKLPVVLCIDRGGLVGADGATHHGVFDIPFLRCIPNLTIASPLDEIEFRNMLYSAQTDPKGPFVIRYPRGRGNIINWKKDFEIIEEGKAEILNKGNDLAIISFGPIGTIVADSIKTLEEEEEHSITHVNLRFIKPLDEGLLHKIFKKHNKIITVEDGSIVGGIGSAMLEFASDNNYKAEIKRIGVPDRFIDHGTVDELYKECGMDKNSIIKAANTLLKEKVVLKAM